MEKFGSGINIPNPQGKRFTGSERQNYEYELPDTAAYGSVPGIHCYLKVYNYKIITGKDMVTSGDWFKKVDVDQKD